ncbi:MAG TPA: NADPH-dependent F420 reductase [Gaiellaceae bacterium]|jgi:8-hydroxy-5-deazaflavin:NADPH oxidoreductase
MKVTIIGAGNMGRGIGTRVVAGGNDVEVIDHDPAEARKLAGELGERASAADTPGGEVVVLALPYGAVADVIGEHRDALTGKVVVDITNPADWSTMDRVVTPEGSSAAEEIAKLLGEDAHVVKAFNTTFAGTLAAGEVAGQPLDVLIAGDDEDAKRTVSSLVEAGGMRPLDLGPLSRARQLEHLGLLHIASQDALGTGFGSAVKLVW